MEVHFIDVGFGNMTLILFPNGNIYLYDCNVTDENKHKVFAYLRKALGSRNTINVFVCSHRDADHMRGVAKVNARYPIQRILDAGVEGTTTSTQEYSQYMELRRKVGGREIRPRTFVEIGEGLIRWMNSKDNRLSDANDQSIVMKIEYRGSGVLLTGDTSFRPWKNIIVPFYADTKLRTNILLASHHGSLTFFDDPSDNKYYYTAHIQKMQPEMTLVSIGTNVHDLPHPKAIELYKKHSSGSNKGNKLYTTQDKGTMKLSLRDNGSWNLKTRQ